MGREAQCDTQVAVVLTVTCGCEERLHVTQVGGEVHVTHMEEGAVDHRCGTQCGT